MPERARIAPYCDPPKQASSARSARLIVFPRLPASRTQSRSGCRAAVARVDDAVLTAPFCLSWSRHAWVSGNPGCLETPTQRGDPVRSREADRDRVARVRVHRSRHLPSALRRRLGAHAPRPHVATRSNPVAPSTDPTEETHAMRSNDKRPKEAVEHAAATESPHRDLLLHENEDWLDRITTLQYRADGSLPKPRTPRKRKAHASKASAARRKQ